MKGKLVKRNEDDYLLYVNDVLPFATSGNSPYKRLSLKNCQAIERGYDLDELAMGYDLYENINFVGQMRAYKAGFQKALELMGDKKFNEEDMKSFARNYYREIRENTSNLLWTQLADKCIEEHIQSLQQTEWDVEVEKENVMHDYNGNISLGAKFKLDADGCLILKRI